MRIEKCSAEMLGPWTALRCALWPGADREAMAQEAPAMLMRSDLLVLLAREEDAVLGFAEASVRHDYVNGCETSPAAFVEGIYVVPEHRRQGVAGALIAAIEQWAREQDLRELASDALLENTQSHAMHKALGFSEMERVVYFRKLLTAASV
jgi:aminoglycoside 6'-N-acetyltransferase I